MRRATISVCCLLMLPIALTTAAFSKDQKAQKPAAVERVKPALKVGTTLDNLQTAYWGETHETLLYGEFAQKADEEGYSQVASMFRAVARAEAIHAAQKEVLIRQMGGIPASDATSDHSLVGTTAENVNYAVEAESYENDTMYPQFIERAEAEKNTAVVKALKLCMASEPGHRLLFQQILDGIDGYKGGSVELQVCPGCGSTSRVLRGDVCLICSTPKSKFEKVK